MSSSPSLTAKILGIEEGAKYQGKVYDQSVLIELQDNNIWVFDQNKEVKNEDISEKKKLAIRSLTYEANEDEINEYGFRKLQESDAKWNYEIRGKIIDRLESTNDRSDFIIQVEESRTVAAKIDSDKLVEGKDVVLKSRLDIEKVYR